MHVSFKAFITASEFFRAKFSGSPYETNFESYFSIGYMANNLLFAGIAIYTQKEVYYPLYHHSYLCCSQCPQEGQAALAL